MAEYASFLGTTNHTEALDNAAKARVQKNGYLVGVEDELEVIQATPAAMSVIVGKGEAWVQGVQYVNPDAKTVTVDAADATHPRIDRIIVRLTWAADTCEAVYLKGTAAASPTAPALTQTTAVWELSLAQILIPVGKTSILTGDITDERNTAYCGQAACNIGTMHINADGSLDAASLLIHSVADPVSAQDADTKAARDAAISSAVATGITGIGGRLLRITLVTASGTFTTTSSTTKIKATLVGGGAGGRGVSANGYAAGEGGGGGGTCVALITVTGSTGYTCTIGAGGAGGAGVGSSFGSDGGNTTIVVGATTYTANGGAGTGAGGSGSNGIVFPGGYGDSACAGNQKGGHGGGSQYSHGARSPVAGAGYGADGIASNGYGGGGSGAVIYNTNATCAGGAGSAGCIIIEEYS